MKTGYIKVNLGTVTESCFVVSSFKEQFKELFDRVLTPLMKECNLTSSIGYDVKARPTVAENVWESIRTSRLVIADLSGDSPNVYYEIGLAHAIGKPIILITDDPRLIPTNISNHRYTIYSRQEYNWEYRLKYELQAEIKSVLSHDLQRRFLEGLEYISDDSSCFNFKNGLAGSAPEAGLSGFWCGYIRQKGFGRQHKLVLYIQVVGKEIFATSNVTLSYKGMVNIVNEFFIGTFESSTLKLTGTAMNIETSVTALDYTLDTFILTWKENESMLTGVNYNPEGLADGDVLLKKNQFR